MRLSFSSILKCTREQAWERLVRIDSLIEASRPLLEMTPRDLPTPNWEPGQTYRFELSLGGIFPRAHHEVRVVSYSPGDEFTTEEKGGAIRDWHHVHRFIALSPTRCRYDDEITFSAGPLWTGPLSVYLRLLYRFRHRHWRSLRWF